MADLLAKNNYKLQSFKRGQKIDATVRKITDKAVIFDIGGKSEGLLVDVYLQEVRDFVKTLKIGDRIRANIMDPETSEGVVLLSLRHAAGEQVWDNLRKLQTDDKELNVNAKTLGTSGMFVEYDSIVGFIPLSQFGKKAAENLSALLGKTLVVKIADVDPQKKRIVFSEKAVSEKEDIAKIKTALANAKEGEIHEGVVTTVTDFGVFVEITLEKMKLEGLVHVSELAWDRVAKPSELLKVGDKVKVKILSLNPDKLAFSIKHAQEDPWETMADKYKVDQKLSGTVSRVSDFGVFVQLESGIEGLIHLTKIPPAMKLKTGDPVNVYVEEIDTKSKKMALGLVLTSKPVGYK